MKVLAPADELEALLPELRRRAQSLALAPKLLFGRSGEALLFSMLFERWPELVAELSVETRFYNRYFWFLRFVALHTDTHGPDAGLKSPLRTFAAPQQRAGSEPVPEPKGSP